MVRGSGAAAGLLAVAHRRSAARCGCWRRDTYGIRLSRASAEEPARYDAPLETCATTRCTWSAAAAHAPLSDRSELASSRRRAGRPRSIGWKRYAVQGFSFVFAGAAEALLMCVTLMWNPRRIIVVPVCEFRRAPCCSRCWLAPSPRSRSLRSATRLDSRLTRAADLCKTCLESAAVATGNRRSRPQHVAASFRKHRCGSFLPRVSGLMTITLTSHPPRRARTPLASDLFSFGSRPRPRARGRGVHQLDQGSNYMAIRRLPACVGASLFIRTGALPTPSFAQNSQEKRGRTDRRHRHQPAYWRDQLVSKRALRPRCSRACLSFASMRRVYPWSTRFRSNVAYGR